MFPGVHLCGGYGPNVFDLLTPRGHPYRPARPGTPPVSSKEPATPGREHVPNTGISSSSGPDVCALARPVPGGTWTSRRPHSTFACPQGLIQVMAM